MSLLFFFIYWIFDFLYIYIYILSSSFFAHEQKFQKNLDRTRAVKQNMCNLTIFYCFFWGGKKGDSFFFFFSPAAFSFFLFSAAVRSTLLPLK